MLLRAVHLPRLYSDLPPDPGVASRHCAQVLGILQDVERNCVLLVDDGNVMTGEISRAIHHWPPKYRGRAKEMLEKLRKSQRFVRLKDGGEVQVTCSSGDCGHTIAVCRREIPEILLGPTVCEGCATLATCEVAFTGIDDYPMSSFSRLRRNSESLTLADSQWDKSEFERNVWDPLFRYAKHVKLFDRYAGRHLQHEGGGYHLSVKANYARSIEWIFGRFAALSAGRTARSFQITCGLESDRLSDAEMLGAAEVLRRFARDLSEKHGMEMSIHVKVESHGSEMPHARWIKTDQEVVLVVERGFDLLKADGTVRDVIVSLIPNPGGLEKRASDLPDVPEVAGASPARPSS